MKPAHLPQAEQDKYLMPFVTRNAEYIAIAKRDKDAHFLHFCIRAMATTSEQRMA
jgi:hypothetical protein